MLYQDAFPMPYDPRKHHRRSIRLKEYDYSEPGAYFVTIVTRNRESLFGEIMGDEMRLSEVGRIVHDEWLRTSTVRPDVELDEFVVMPNHVHGVIMIKEQTVGATRRVAPTIAPGSLGAIVGQFKSIVTKRANKLRNAHGVPLWQRNFYDHIIRNDKDLNRIREYIRCNPSQWCDDEENPNIHPQTEIA